jgi:hypothetical protein
MPIVRRTSSGATLGPSRKILVGAAVSEELENSGPEAASEVIGRSIEDDISRSLDALTFDDLPDDGVRPAGLLNGLTALTPTAGSGLDAISGDVANIAGQIADNGVRSSNMVIVCNPRQRAKLVTLVGSKFDYEVLDSPQIPDGRVIGIAPSCVVSAYSGVPKLERASNALVHLEDTTPTDIGIVGSPATVAAPVLSAAQCGLIVIRLRCESAFARVAPGIAFVDSVSW